MVSADVARGDGKDYSTFHIFKIETMEVVGEYQGKLTPDMFARMLLDVGRQYGECMVVVENNSVGWGVLTKLQEKNYPNLLVTTGLHDSQVQYWEPAKWVAKLRELKKGENLLLLKTNMNTGHGGASGRFEYLKEIAFDYAFLFKLEGISN